MPPPRIRRFPVPIQVADPALCRVLGQISFKFDPSMLGPPLALVVPAPDMVPPLKVVRPLTFKTPLPPRTPPLTVKVAVLASGAAVSKLAMLPSTKVRPATL